MTRFQRILVPVDSSSPDAGLLEFVARLARSHGAEITLCDVVREFSWAQRFVLPNVAHIQELISEEKQRQLTAIGEQLGIGRPVTSTVLRGPASDAFAKKATEGQHDLIVMLAKGPYSRRKGFFGTSAYRLLQIAPCSILLFEPGKVGTFQRIVSSVDATPDDRRHASLNERILEATQAIVEAEKCPWDIVFAWNVYGEYLIKGYLKRKEFEELFASAEAQFAKSFEALLQRHGLDLHSPNVHLRHGEASEQVHDVACEVTADLIVLGTVARSGMARMWLGNTAESLLDRAKCSVFIVKPKSE